MKSSFLRVIAPHYSHLRKTLTSLKSCQERTGTLRLGFLAAAVQCRAARSGEGATGSRVVRGKTAAAPLLRYRQGTTRCLLKTLDSTVAAVITKPFTG